MRYPDPKNFDSPDDYYDAIETYEEVQRVKREGYDGYDPEDEEEPEYDYDKAANDYFDQIDRAREEKYR